MTIDTKEFRDLLGDMLDAYRKELQGGPMSAYEKVQPKFIAHIDAQLSAARAAGPWNLLREARSTLEMWKDVAPAISLCADIDRALATQAAPTCPYCGSKDGTHDKAYPHPSKDYSAAPSVSEQDERAIPKYETVLLTGDKGQINSETIEKAMREEIAAYRARAALYQSVQAAQGGELERAHHADYHYLLGLRAGWNLSQQRDVGGFNAALVSRQISLDEAKKELAAQGGGVQDMRALFEECHPKMNLARYADGRYVSGYTQIAWEGWQAAIVCVATDAANPAPSAAQVGEPVYQAYLHTEGWHDITQGQISEYEGMGHTVRTLYAAPSEQQAEAPSQAAREVLENKAAVNGTKKQEGSSCA